jgi:hypothetical protein
LAIVEFAGCAARYAHGHPSIGDAADSAIGSGYLNRIESRSDRSAIASGESNRITSGADFSSIPGGHSNEIQAPYGFAAGRRAKALHQGVFVWADSSDFDFASLRDNMFAVRATGGVSMVTAIDGSGNASAGVSVAPGSGSWASVSDRNAKENIEAVDAQAILKAVATLPVSTWNYKSQDDAVRHLGPMAQDFAAAFGLGENDTTINTVDADGVSLAAIQALYHLVQAQQAQIDALAERVRQLEAERLEAP